MRVAFPSLFRSSCSFLAGGIAAVALATGCAGDKVPSLSEQIAAEGESHAQFAKEVADAEEAKTDAEKDIKAAKKAIKRAQKALEDGKQDLEEANQRLVESTSRLAEVEAEAQRRGFAIPPRP